MSYSEHFLTDARTRLEATEPKRRKTGSVIGRVEALCPDIRRARTAGKTWAQIAEAISAGERLKTDAVRIAFYRAEAAAALKNTMRIAEPLENRKATPPEPVVRTVVADMQDMFAPMFDARDTRGREKPLAGSGKS